jgi:hypothetical protein
VKSPDFNSYCPDSEIQPVKWGMPIRPELVRKYVMASMADDYESLELIVDSVSALAREDGFPAFDKQAVQTEISELIRDGYAKAYILSPTPPHAVVTEYLDTRADEFWFMLTALGIQAMNGQH